MSPIPTISARFSIHYRKSNPYTAVAQFITLILRTTLQSLSGAYRGASEGALRCMFIMVLATLEHLYKCSMTDLKLIKIIKLKVHQLPRSQGYS